MNEKETDTYIRKEGVFNISVQSEKLFSFLSKSEENESAKIIEEHFRDITKIPLLEIDDLGTNTSNKKKNRYGDVLPLKNTVVRLSRVGNDINSEYINANFIQDIEREGIPYPQKFICTQAPLPHTFTDFWRMTWEYNVHLIVMLTNMTERNKTKADIYWPKTPNIVYRYGNISVKLVREKTRCQSIVIRYFDVWYEEIESENSEEVTNSDDGGSDIEEEILINIANNSENTTSNSDDDTPSPMEVEVLGKDVRRIVQIHCTEWPDFGVPNSTEIMKDIVNEVDVRKKGAQDPIIIHCSAGIGRTGTFVSIYICLQRFKLDKNYDIKETVINLRKQRLGMVQSLEQYMFVHQVVSELIEERDYFTLLKINNKSIVFEGSKSPKKNKKDTRGKNEKKEYKFV